MEILLKSEATVWMWMIYWVDRDGEVHFNGAYADEDHAMEDLAYYTQAIMSKGGGIQYKLAPAQLMEKQT